MRSRHWYATLTLVLSLFTVNDSFGATDVTTSDIKETEKTESATPEGLNEMNVSPVAPVNEGEVKASKQGVYFPYQSSVSPRFALGTDTNRIKTNMYYHLFGLLYQLPSEDGRHWEAGADVMDDGTGVLSIGRKFRMNHTEAVRPYFKIGGALHVIPSEQLTTFLRTDNYQLRPSTGFEYFLEHPSSVRLEIESWISLRYIGFHIAIGYSYAW